MRMKVGTWGCGEESHHGGAATVRPGAWLEPQPAERSPASLACQLCSSAAEGGVAAGHAARHRVHECGAVVVLPEVEAIRQEVVPAVGATLLVALRAGVGRAGGLQAGGGGGQRGQGW